MEEPLVKREDPPLVFGGEDGEVTNFTEDPSLATELTQSKNLERLSFLPLCACIIFAFIYMMPMWDTQPIAHSCFALLIVIAFLWSTEGIPAFATSYIVPLLAVWLGLGYNKVTGKRIPASELASMFSYKFMDPIIFVFLGSMTMSECLAKFNITDRVSGFVFKRMSKKPIYILLSLMLLNWATSAFLSNVASTTLVLTFTMPIIRSLDPDDPFIKALLLGIAWSGNSGGMPTTISSPQNILALKYVHDNTPHRISFFEWMSYGVPVSFLHIIAQWIYLMYRFKPERSQIIIGEAKTEYPEWGVKHTFACIVTIVTILLWTMNESFPEFLGNVGITSMIPVIFFFGSEMMTIKDFHSIRWSTLSLMGGGLALGEAMKVSGLLDLVAELSHSVFGNIKIYPLLLIFLLVESIFASLINSTSAAAILYPVIAAIGEPTGKPTLLVVLSALMVSSAQLFHISSFSNALTFGVCRHRYGKPDEISQRTFLEGKDFFIFGWPTVIMGLILTASVGYGIALRRF